jgi:hypothetical protein
VIVRPAPGALHLITQPDHAALARRMMDHWTALADHPRRNSILHAVGAHDNGWREPDAAPMVDANTGRIADFINAPAAVRQGVWPRAVAELEQDPWAAALVAQHAIVVYDRLRGDTEWTTFFPRLESIRDALLRGNVLTLNELRQDYSFVRLGDLLSLTFCTAWTDPQEYGGFTVQRRGSCIEVTPDPFAGRTIPFEIVARELREQQFDSDVDLRRQVATAPVVLLRGEVAGHGAPALEKLLD